MLGSWILQEQETQYFFLLSQSPWGNSLFDDHTKMLQYYYFYVKAIAVCVFQTF